MWVGVRPTGITVPALPLSSGVILGKILKLAEP